MDPAQVLRLMRASDAGDTRASYALQTLQERAMRGDAYVGSLLVEARGMGQSQQPHATRVSVAGVTTERRGEAMVITVNQPGGNQMLAFLVGAATIVIGVILGIMIPGIVRRQNAK